MDLLKKIKEIKNRVDKFEELIENLSNNNLDNEKKITHLKIKIKENIEKIDKIIKNNNANT